jgi:hypothetical protein
MTIAIRQMSGMTRIRFVVTVYCAITLAYFRVIARRPLALA